MAEGVDGKADLAKAVEQLAKEMDENSKAVRESTRAQGRDARGRFTGGGGGAAGGGGGMGAASAALAGLGPVGMAAAAMGGFAENAAIKAGREFAADTVAGVAGDFAKFGFGAKGVSFSDSVTASALRAGGSIPIVGDLFEQVTQPLDAAAGRTAGITSAIARAGGKVDPEMRQALFRRFNEEEIRARDENNEVEKLKKSDDVARGAAMEGTRLEGAMQGLVDNLGSIAVSLAAILANPSQAPSVIANAAVQASR